MDRVWKLGQDPALHPRWDLRFSRITPIEQDGQGLLHFRYEFRIPLHVIQGTGTSLGHRFRPDGQATSVLKFDTADPVSPIGQGSGYWRYIPTEDGLRFITGYNHQPGMGALGKALDPQDSRNRWLIDAAARAGGVLTACFLLRRALAGRTAGPAALGLTAAAASWMLPSHWTVPRAGRCLRRAPDPRSGRAPSALAELPGPATRGLRAKPGAQE